MTIRTPPTLRRTATTLAALAALAACALPGAAQAQAQPTIDQLYQAAKSEGKLSVVLPPNAPLRKLLAEAFAKRFPDIELELQGMAGSAVATKLRAETRSSVHSTDVIVSGTTTGVSLLKPLKMLRPLDPMIVSPEARDPSKWPGGALEWSDPDDKTTLVMTVNVSVTAIYNTDMVKPGALSRDADLIDPKWKGKIAMNDPTRPGAAHVRFRQLFDLYGPDFIRKLMAQEPAITSDLRQVVDWVAKGRYPIAIGVSPTAINPFVDKGVTTLGLDANAHWKDPLWTTAGFGALMMPVEVPHPAAAKFFANWILTREAQIAVAEGLGYSSLRTDVPAEIVPEYMRTVPGKTYRDTYTEAWLRSENERNLRALYKELQIGAR